MPDPKNEKVMTKEEIKNLGMQELAEKLYVEFAKLQAHFRKVHPLDTDAAVKRSTELADGAEQVMFGFNDYQYENLEVSEAPAKDPAANFKKAVKAAVDYLDVTEPSGYSLRNYAELRKITSPEFRYLMNRCMDITGVAPKGLNDDEIAGYDMDEMEERVRLVHDAIFMTLRRNGLKLPEEAMNVVGSLNGYSLEEQPEEKEKSFKDAMRSWDAFFNAKLSNGQTVAEYAEENDLLSYGYEKLVRRAKEIAGIEVAEPEVEQKQAPEEQEPEQKPEQEPAELTDEAVAGLGMEDVADKLYGELVKLEVPLLDDYGEKWSAEAEKVDRYFIDYKGSDGFKNSVEEAQKFLDTPLSADKTIADYAKEKKLLGKTFEKLMKRANEIASMERQADQEQPELNDEAVAGLGMKDVADQLYGELVKLEDPLLDDYGEKWSAEAEKVYRYFIDYKGSDGFKKSVEDTKKFLETKLSEDEDKTIADYAKEKKLLGNTFEKLMNRAVEIASMERQAEEEQPEAEADQEQPEAEAEQEQPELNDERSADLDESVVVRAPVRKTAAKWIEGYKERLATKVKGKEKGDNYPAADIALIFAARELSDSVRGKASTLNKEMTNGDIKARADKIMANKSFQDFAAKLSKGENLRKVEAIFTKKHSHGGELDDLFRDYLTKRPAGQLENDPDLKRWMPTVKQRVEFLQKEAAKTQKENKTPYKEAAEILLLRQAAGVQRGGKGLETKVPVAGEKASSLSEAVNSNADNKDFQKAFDQPDVKKYILAGHGGEMVERLNQQREAEKGKQDNGQEKGM